MLPNHGTKYHGDVVDSKSTRDTDGDGLPDGSYQYDEARNQFIRTGDAVPLQRFRGMKMPKGVVADTLHPSDDNVDEDDGGRWLEKPVVFSTPDENVAMTYAFPDPRWSPDREGQIYDLTLTPTEVTDLGHCEDSEQTRLATALGFDVVDCPDFTSQPETVSFHTNQVKIDQVNRVNATLDARDIAVSALPAKSSGGNPYSYLDGLERGERLFPNRDSEAVADAVQVYKSHQSRAPQDTALDRTLEYRGLSQEPSYAPRSGRGKMRY